MTYNDAKIPGLEINERTGMYQIRENKITYDFGFELLSDLKNYLEFEASRPGKIAAWYRSLNSINQRRVIINAGLEA
jgi:hypothetical protein